MAKEGVRHAGSPVAILWQSAAPRPGTESILPHQPADTMQPAGKNVLPDATGTVGAVPALESAVDHAEQHRLVGTALGVRLSQAWKPGRDTFSVAQPYHRPDVALLRNESEASEPAPPEPKAAAQAPCGDLAAAGRRSTGSSPISCIQSTIA